VTPYKQVTKISNEQVPWICVLVMRVNKFTTTTTASTHVTAWHPTALVWLG